MPSTSKVAYKRVLLKLSGEALMGEQKFGIEHRPCQYIAHAIKEVYALGVQMGIVYPCVFNLFEQGAMLKAVCGQKKGLLVIGGENEQRHGTDKIENASSA